MNSRPLLSVIVPVYNTSHWLRKCMDSICGQTYGNLEILCVNDGSTDDSAAILEEYAAKDSRIKVFTQANGGLSAARNTALEHATGEWVLGVDSDDYLAPDALAKAMEKAHSEVDMVCMQMELVSESGEHMDDASGYYDLPRGSELQMNPALAVGINVCFCGKLWRRSVIETHGLMFPVGLVHEDEAFHYLAAPWIRHVACSRESVYYYLQRSGSIMQMKASAVEAARRAARAVQYVQEHAYEQHREYHLCMLWRVFAQCFRHTGREQRAEVIEVFRKYVPASAVAGDYRTDCLLRESTRWLRYEPARKVYCFLRVPLLARLFNGSRFYTWQFALWLVLKSRLFR